MARDDTSTTPGRVGDVRRQNLSLVLGHVTPRGQTTRAQIAAETGLTKASVSSLVAELIATGLLTEIGVSHDGERGRPGVGLSLNSRRAALGAEVNVDYSAVGVVDLTGELIHYEMMQCNNPSRHPDEVIESLGHLVTDAVDAATRAGVVLLGGALAVPGLVDATERVVLTAPNLHWSDLDLSAELDGLIPDTPFGVTLSNEANSAALAELWFGHGADLGDYLYVSGDVGVGGGLVIGSALYAGPSGHAGEIGHIVVHPDGPPCSCGGRGCLETFAGEEAIFSAAGISQGGNPARMDSLLGGLAADDAGAVSAVETAADHLGIAVASAARTTGISAVVLGGHFAVLAEWIVPRMRSSLARRAPGLIEPHRVAVSELSQPAAVMGAAGSCLRDVIARPHLLGARGTGDRFAR